MKKETIFKAGDIIVSEDRDFRLVLKIIYNKESSLTEYKCMDLTDNSFQDIFNRKFEFKVGTISEQPTSIVEKYYHYYQLK